MIDLGVAIFFVSTVNFVFTLNFVAATDLGATIFLTKIFGSAGGVVTAILFVAVTGSGVVVHFVAAVNLLP